MYFNNFYFLNRWYCRCWRRTNISFHTRAKLVLGINCKSLVSVGWVTDPRTWGSISWLSNPTFCKWAYKAEFCKPKEILSNKFWNKQMSLTQREINWKSKHKPTIHYKLTKSRYSCLKSWPLHLHNLKICTEYSKDLQQKSASKLVYCIKQDYISISWVARKIIYLVPNKTNRYKPTSNTTSSSSSAILVFGGSKQRRKLVSQKSTWRTNWFPYNISILN